MNTRKYCLYPWANGTHFCGREASHVGRHACCHFDIDDQAESWQYLEEKLNGYKPFMVDDVRDE